MIPLFRRFPVLSKKLPHVALGEFPTPVQRLPALGAALGLEHLYVKRDDQSGRTYGGNKVRKLEFLLGQALRERRREVMTFGCAGSNHALATALYARSLGLRSISMLFPQPNAAYVRRNLLMSCRAGAELNHYDSFPQMQRAVKWVLLRHFFTTGKFPLVIPAGGSSPLGSTGFVNAAFELKEQVERGELPEPDLLYVALGTTGTYAGLKLGCAAAGLRTRVVPVRVVEKQFMGAELVLENLNALAAFLHARDASFPGLQYTVADLGIEDDCLGPGYALFTEAGLEAMVLMQEKEGITLDGTYTAKVAAALVKDARAGRLAGKTVLFWNTLNSRDFSSEIKDLDYHVLPKSLHRYFEEPLQEE